MRFSLPHALVALAVLVPGQSLAQTGTDSETRPLTRNEIGVIFMAHGADSAGNAAMQRALAPLSKYYTTANAYGLANPFNVEAALRDLEAKGMRAAVMVYMIELEPDRAQGDHDMSLPQRFETPLKVVTTGGMEAHPLLGQAMADRVRTLSTLPTKETVILTGYGAASDADNSRWMENLAILGVIIREETRLSFRDIQIGTWRQDWPEKRDSSVTRIRRLVEAAGKDGGTALVIPVRPIGQGPADHWLEGLEYRLGEGFAPHPAFIKWVASEIEEGFSELLGER